MGIEFDKCCFCIELRTGSLIIGYLNLIAYIILILIYIIGLAATGAAVSKYEQYDTHDLSDTVQTMGAVMFTIICVLVFFLILFLAFTIVLLVGLHQHKRGHVKAYLIYTSIFLVVNIVLFFASFAAPLVSPVGVVRDIISITLSTYLLLVIRSYYLKMDDPANKPAVYSVA